MFIDHMGAPVGGDEVQGDFGIFGHERQRDRHHMACAELDRHGDRQFAARRVIFARRAPFGLVEVGDNPPCGFDIIAPGIGELDVAAGADEEVGAEMSLEFGDLAADAGERRIQLAAPRGQAARVDDRQNHPHGVKTIHLSPSLARTLNSGICPVVTAASNCRSRRKQTPAIGDQWRVFSGMR